MSGIDPAALALVDLVHGEAQMPAYLLDFDQAGPPNYAEIPNADLTIFGPLRRLGWMPNQSWLVLREYKRFLTLLMRNEQPIVPPHLVDTVWRLHHCYPSSYGKFCRSVLDRIAADHPEDLEKMERTMQSVARRLFEHDLETSSDASKYADQHRATVGFYLEVFGLPPLNIWSKPAPIAERPGW